LEQEQFGRPPEVLNLLEVRPFLPKKLGEELVLHIK
jgi:hypothetical protein